MLKSCVFQQDAVLWPRRIHLLLHQDVLDLLERQSMESYRICSPAIPTGVGLKRAVGFAVWFLGSVVTYGSQLSVEKNLELAFCWTGGSSSSDPLFWSVNDKDKDHWASRIFQKVAGLDFRKFGITVVKDWQELFYKSEELYCSTLVLREA